MNEPLDPDDDTADPGDAVLESANLPVDPPVPAAAAMGWDEPAGSVGTRSPVPSDSDPEDIARQLVQAGNDEAGREQRLAADDMDSQT